METRVEKFKKYREEIKRADMKEEVEEITEETPVEDLDKKNTLTMTIDQIIEAHDQYVSNQAKEDLLAREKAKKRAYRLTKMKQWLKYLALIITIGAIICLIIVCVFIAS